MTGPDTPEKDPRPATRQDQWTQRTPDAVAEETLRVKAKLVELYGWEGFQRVMARMESDLAQAEQALRSR